MLFNSIEFLLFFLVVTTLYYLLPYKYRWVLLLLASCYFYMAFVPVYILILGFTIIVDYFAGLYIEKNTGRKRKLLLIVSLVANIGVLCVFKYYNFLNANLSFLLAAGGHKDPFPFLSILLPIGLSFHTFQAMSYTIEVYRGNQPAEKSFGIYALYVMFYPQLVAGPIERPQNLLHQFREKHDFNSYNVSSGLKQMLIGFLKKLVIADRISIYVDTVYNNSASQNGRSLACATIFFAFQIYCDFSAYSDIAIGAAKTMGFDLMKNFNRPYLATSISQFWRRWHISLSTWFKDYLYIPLGGSRVKHKYRQYLNLLIVFTISGLWHGANWTYLVWGGLNGLFLIVESALPTVHIAKNWLLTTLKTLITFFAVCTTWVFFRAENVSQAFIILRKIIKFDGPLYPGNPKDHFYYAAAAIFFLIFFEWVAEYKPRLYQYIPNNYITRLGYYTFIVAIIMLFGVFGGGQFIYFQF
ncbi:MBOAT family O-acyltransferase [Mucilaginibacter jinjuensis]|uniref:MBOAT family protein n=1 Tax=Mucilaginibacter jinjuensis TaxID=1176721 RepID=A0ABY7TB07_9SPHI|nr:MBOAT family O-acyltransferase [Mucilaginibacter jinjuensis]WCT13526.1 MBOAT family protein [Mucilaginibacter jinjuensis]